MIRLLFLVLLLGSFSLLLGQNTPHHERPNFIFAISDDQSYPHASAYGATGISTPAFDQLARRGVLFHNAFAPAPQCSPSRAAILTGLNIWQLEEAGTHGSYFPSKFPVFTRALEEHGYHVGYTGKPWGPGNWQDAGWDRNPVGSAYNSRHFDNTPTTGIRDIDYAGNFEEFLDARSGDQPFFFWYGGQEPHRRYEEGSGVAAGKSLDDAQVPPFLPQHDSVKSDYLDYALEIEWFDQQLAKMLEILDARGELENTIIVVTADNGMPFPYAKANLQEFGSHVPLVMAGPAYFPGGRETRALTSLIDLTPTFLELAGAPPMKEISGKSLIPLLRKDQAHRDAVFTGRERHTHARPDNLGYPGRAIRTREFLYVWNLAPTRWPMGIPRPEGLTEEQYTGVFSKDFKAIGEGYADIDDSPTKSFQIVHRDEYPDLFHLAFLKRPEEQLYNVITDPWCLNNLARNPQYAQILTQLRDRLRQELSVQGDPRMTDDGEIFESYPRFGGMRWYPGFKTHGEYNPNYQRQHTTEQ